MKMLDCSRKDSATLLLPLSSSRFLVTEARQALHIHPCPPVWTAALGVLGYILQAHRVADSMTSFLPPLEMKDLLPRLLGRLQQTVSAASSLWGSGSPLKVTLSLWGGLHAMAGWYEAAKAQPPWLNSGQLRRDIL